MTDRIPLGDLTPDALDALYDRLEQAVEHAAALDEADSAAAAAGSYAGRAEQAEAALARVRELHRLTCLVHRHNLKTVSCHTCAHLAGLALDTVVLTQARHQHLLAGQCIHHQEVHRLHHSEPVPGCPYPGCHPNA